MPTWLHFTLNPLIWHFCTYKSVTYIILIILLIYVLPIKVTYLTHLTLEEESVTYYITLNLYL